MSNELELQARIYVAGHRGLVGSALVRALLERGSIPPITRSHAALDLTDQSATESFFDEEQPDVVILAAALVGGIHANNVRPAEFIQDNLAIQTNVINASYRSGVKKLLFLGSSCIYPRDCPQPIEEKSLLTGPLEITNRPYAIAKIAGIEACWSFNRQFGTRFFSVMPTNLYGPGDNYDLYNSHVLPALVRKFDEAKTSGDSEVCLWGTGTPLRELLFCDDLAQACLRLLFLPDHDLEFLFDEYQPPIINVGSGDELSTANLAKIVSTVVGFKGRIQWDVTKPDGTPRKLLDSSRIGEMGWRPVTPLVEGISTTYRDYLERKDML